MKICNLLAAIAVAVSQLVEVNGSHFIQGGISMIDRGPNGNPSITINDVRNGAGNPEWLSDIVDGADMTGKHSKDGRKLKPAKISKKKGSKKKIVKRGKKNKKDKGNNTFIVLPNTPNNSTVCRAICGKGKEYFQDVEIFLKQLQTNLTKFLNFTNNTILADVTSVNNIVNITNTTVAGLLEGADVTVDLRKARLAKATQAVTDLNGALSEEEKVEAVEAAQAEEDAAGEATDAATEVFDKAAEAADAAASTSFDAMAAAADVLEASDTAAAVALDIAAAAEFGLNPFVDAAAGVADGLDAAATVADGVANAAAIAADGVTVAEASAEAAAMLAEEAEEAAKEAATAAEAVADGEGTAIVNALPKALENEAKCAKALKAAEKHQSDIKKALGLTAKADKVSGFLLEIVNDILDYTKDFIGFVVELLKVIMVGDDVDKDFCVACGKGDFIDAIIKDGLEALVRKFLGKLIQTKVTVANIVSSG